MRLATSSCNPACQERRNIAHCFTARSRADAFCHKRMQTRMAGGSHHTDIDQRSEQSQKCRLNHGCSERASFFRFSYKIKHIKPGFCYSPVRILPTSSSKNAARLQRDAFF
jgi:hypothetical protein